jgi:hypothetical protein
LPIEWIVYSAPDAPVTEKSATHELLFVPPTYDIVTSLLITSVTVPAQAGGIAKARAAKKNSSLKFKYFISVKLMVNKELIKIIIWFTVF